MATSPAAPVPRAWRTVLRLALTARPNETGRALMQLLRGRKVRAWNLLSLIAAGHRYSYEAWIAASEPALLVTEPAPPVSIGIVLLAGDSQATRDSIVAAFGSGTIIFDGNFPTPVTDCPTWLLPIHAKDCLSPALGVVLANRLADNDASLVYWDEDWQDMVGRRDPWVKPGWDPLLFHAHEGLIGSCVVRADLVPTGIVEDWGALLYEIATRHNVPLHIPLILTHRAQRRTAVARSIDVAPTASASIIIPTRDRVDLLEVCLAGLAKTDFPGDHEIIIVDNDSVESRTKVLFEQLERSGRGRVVTQHGPFNFAALCNSGVAAASGDLVCLLNNDIEIIDPGWLKHMAALASRDEIGAVGAKLLYPNGVIQHAGVALGIGDAAGHVDKGVIPVPGEFAPWHAETRTVSAVTAACLLVDRAKYAAVGGMDTETFTIDFNDVDLCLRLATRGWRTVYCAAATLIHHESRSRGTKREGLDRIRFERELGALRARWGTVGMGDPYHSPLFRRQSERCLLAF